MTHLIPNATITPNACAPGIPSADVIFTSQSATSLSISGTPTLFGPSAAYTLIAAFPPADVAWITAFGTACSALHTFTFVTTGPTDVFRSIASAASAGPQLAIVTATAMTTVAGATVVFSTPGPQQTLSTPSPPPSNSPALFFGALAGFIVVLVLVSVLLTLLCVWCVRSGRRRRSAGAGTGADGVADRSEISDAVPPVIERWA